MKTCPQQPQPRSARFAEIAWLSCPHAPVQPIEASPGILFKSPEFLSIEREVYLAKVVPRGSLDEKALASSSIIFAFWTRACRQTLMITSSKLSAV